MGGDYRGEEAVFFVLANLLVIALRLMYAFLPWTRRGVGVVWGAPSVVSPAVC